MEVKFLRQSMIKTAQRCLQQFYYAYVLQLTRPIRLKTEVGSAFHSGYEFYFKTKKEHEKTPTVKALREISVYKFEETLKKAKEVDVPIDERDETTPNEAKDEIVKAVDIYYPKAETITPELIEQEFEVNLKNVSYVLQGKIDLVTKDKTIIDYKTTRIAVNKNTIVDDTQLLVYYLGAKKLLQTNNFKLQYDNILIRKIKPEVQVIPVEYNQVNLERLMRIIQMTRNIIVNIEKAHPPSPSPVNCSWCGYYRLCSEGKFNAEDF